MQIRKAVQWVGVILGILALVALAVVASAYMVAFVLITLALS